MSHQEKFKWKVLEKVSWRGNDYHYGQVIHDTKNSYMLRLEKEKKIQLVDLTISQTTNSNQNIIKPNQDETQPKTSNIESSELSDVAATTVVSSTIANNAVQTLPSLGVGDEIYQQQPMIVPISETTISNQQDKTETKKREGRKKVFWRWTIALSIITALLCGVLIPMFYKPIPNYKKVSNAQARTALGIDLNFTNDNNPDNDSIYMTTFGYGPSSHPNVDHNFFINNLDNRVFYVSYFGPSTLDLTSTYALKDQAQKLLDEYNAAAQKAWEDGVLSEAETSDLTAKLTAYVIKLDEMRKDFLSKVWGFTMIFKDQSKISITSYTTDPSKDMTFRRFGDEFISWLDSLVDSLIESLNKVLAGKQYFVACDVNNLVYD